MPAVLQGRSAGASLWKVHYEDAEDFTSVREDLDAAELADAMVAYELV